MVATRRLGGRGPSLADAAAAPRRLRPGPGTTEAVPTPSCTGGRGWKRRSRRSTSTGESRPDLERDFVEAGRHARDAEVRSARRTARRLRRLLVAAAAALVVALVAGAVAVVQRRQADDNATEAEVQAERAETAAAEAQIEALVGRAESLRQTQRDTAALLAVEAYRLADTPRTRSALLATFTDRPDVLRRPPPGGRRRRGRHRDARRRVGVRRRRQGRLRPYGLDTGSLGDPLPAIGDMTAGTSVLAASADGRWLAQAWRSDLGDGPTTVGVFDTSTGSLRFPPLAVDGAVWSAAFTPDAAELALAIDEEARLLVVDAATGAERASAPGVTVPALGGEAGLEPQAGGVGPTPRPPAVALAGDELLLGAADGSLRAFDAATFELRRTIALAPDTLASIRPLDDGTLLTAGRRGISRVDPGNGRVLWQHDQGLSDIGDAASGATCAHLAVIEQRGTFYCANAYGRLAEHDLSSGYAIRVLDAQNGNSGPLWPARDGTELVSFGDNEAVVSRWRLDGSGPITHLVAPGFRGCSFNPSGDRLLVEQGGAFDGDPSQVIDVGVRRRRAHPRRADQRRLARRRHRGRGDRQRRRPGRDRPHRPPGRRARRRRVRRRPDPVRRLPGLRQANECSSSSGTGRTRR